MIKLQRGLLPLLFLGGLVIFTIENWSPSVPLVIFSTKTIALPLSLWILAACLAGALTTVAIALCLRFLIQASHRSTKEDVQSFGAPMPQAPRQTTHRSNDQSTPPDSTSQSFPSRFNPLRVTRPSSGPGSAKAQQSPSKPSPSKQGGANKAAVDVGMEEWEDFSRPREDWDDWQRSKPVVTEVDFDQPMTSGSRFGRSPGHTSRRDRDRYSYSYDEDPQADYGAYDDRSDRYPQEPQAGYAPPRDVRDDYSTADYGGDRYDPGRYDPSPYASEDYAQAPYGDDNPYGHPERDNDYYQPDPAPPYEQNRAQNRAQNSEQYIMDYGDEAALDAFDAELEAQSKSRAKTDPGNDTSSQTGRYRWKNPFNTQPQTSQNATPDDDLDLSSLDDWDE